MKPSRLHLAALAFILPLCATVFSVWWMLREDEDRARMKAGAVLNERLVAMAEKADDAQAGWTQRLERVAAALAVAPLTDSLRGAGETEPLVRTAALLDADGVLMFPKAEDASLREREFLERSADLLAEPWTPKPAESAGKPTDRSGLASGSRPTESGWQRFYWRDGMQLIYWKALPENAGYLLLEIERSALLAELAASVGSPPWPEGRRDGHSVVLADEQGNAFLSWPDRSAKFVSVPEALQAERVRSSLALGGALQGWQFTWEADLTAIPGTSDMRLALGLLLGLVVAGSGLAAFSLFRRLDREVREAGQRVSFVNQVSHELKTPLTNIRLYAEMLEAKIDAREGGVDSKESQYTGIILRESARLSRLIHNVLTFARLAKSAEPGGGGMISLHARLAVPDDIIRKAIEGFSVSLAEKGMHVELAAGAPDAMEIDPDICEQLLGNLISNAEKYARTGGYVKVTTSVSAGAAGTSAATGNQAHAAYTGAGRLLKIEVCDRGPGLPPHAAARAFQPFVRFHDRHTDGAGGAGLGLAIVRELSALHGGEAGYRERSGGGACFYFTLASQGDDNHSAEDPV